MDFVGSISRRLSSAEREALSNAVEQLDDFLLSELVELHDETKPKRIATMTPPLWQRPVRAVRSVDDQHLVVTRAIVRQTTPPAASIMLINLRSQRTGVAALW